MSVKPVAPSFATQPGPTSSLRFSARIPGSEALAGGLKRAGGHLRAFGGNYNDENVLANAFLHRSEEGPEGCLVLLQGFESALGSVLQKSTAAFSPIILSAYTPTTANVATVGGLTIAGRMIEHGFKAAVQGSERNTLQAVTDFLVPGKTVVRKAYRALRQTRAEARDAAAYSKNPPPSFTLDA